MYSPFRLALKYLRYWITAKNGKGHGMHSPFVFEFITKVMNDNRKYPAYAAVEKLRQSLLQDNHILEVEDFGAGSGKARTNQRTVQSIARHAAKPRKFGQLLFRMAQYYKPATIVELGTSLGITTGYLASGHRTAKVITLEGAKAILAKAGENFRQLGLTPIETVAGNFDETLSSVVSSLSSVDFIFLDGNHRKEPTLRYFQQMLPVCHNNTLLVFDDIHWSKEMEEAWGEIKTNPAVTCTLDLFFIGIVILRKEIKERQHFAIRF